MTANRTSIAWTDFTVNTGRGCTKKSRGCFLCYAEGITTRWGGDFTEVTLRPKGFDDLFALSRKVQRQHEEDGLWPDGMARVFINSMTDTFHGVYEVDYIARLFAVAAQTPNLIYQVLTKEHARMRYLMNEPHFQRRVAALCEKLPSGGFVWPLSNVWLGVSTEDPKWAAIRIHALLQTTATTRWISAEPLLDPIDLKNLAVRNGSVLLDCLGGDVKAATGEIYAACPSVLDMVVVGGESGAINRRDPWDAPDDSGFARPMRLEWARDLAAQTRKHSHVSMFVKQLGSVQAHLLGLKDRKGENWDEWPGALDDLRVRAFPRYVREA
jgi:protein gp37